MEDNVCHNDLALKLEISGETRFESLVGKVEYHVEALSVHNPYTPEQILSIAFALVKDTCYYTDGCKVWKRRTDGTKTWPQFKIFSPENSKKIAKRKRKQESDFL